MNNLDIVSLSKDNKSENKSQDNTIKIILEALKEKYSLKLLVEAIISETTIPNKEKEKMNSNNNINNELNNIIALICQKIGTTEIFKYILDIKNDNNEKHNNNENKQFLNIKLNNKDKGNFKNIEMPITTKVKEDTNNKIDNLISLDEEEGNKEHFSYIENSNNGNVDSGGKSELKIIKNLDNRQSIDISNNIYSENKCTKVKKKKIKKLYCHCSIINNFFYKYKLKSINNKGIANFFCANTECKGCGIYNINNKTFTLQKGHDNENNENNCCANNNLDGKDKIIYEYMKYYNIEELQITK